MLTGHRDTDIYLSQQLDDRDLINFCIANKNLGICQDENFWKQRFISKHGKCKKPANRTWKKYYLQIVYYLNKGNNNINKAMKFAAEKGHQDLIDCFISKGANYWDWGMHGAAVGGHQELVEFFISKGANGWNWGMGAASLGGHSDLVEFFQQKLNK